MKVVLAYVPVLDSRYHQFFDAHKDAAKIWVMGPELIAEFDYLRKDIRKLEPRLVVRALKSWSLGPDEGIADRQVLKEIALSRATVVMPDEEEMSQLAAAYLPGCPVAFENIFLRWDGKRVLAHEEVQPDRVVSFQGFVAEMMGLALAESKRATNFWRQVGAVVVRGGKVLLVGYNRQVPSAQTPYYEGDPRLFFNKGLHIALTTDEHAEAGLIGQAAAQGTALKRSDLYVTLRNDLSLPALCQTDCFSGNRSPFFLRRIRPAGRRTSFERGGSGDY